MIQSLVAFATTAPRWFLIVAAAVISLASHGTAYRLGAAHEFRAGFTAGQHAAIARDRAAADRRTTRQIEDRLNAETAPSSLPHPDGLRCGPSARDCPD